MKNYPRATGYSKFSKLPPWLTNVPQGFKDGLGDLGIDSKSYSKKIDFLSLQALIFLIFGEVLLDLEFNLKFAIKKKSWL